MIKIAHESPKSIFDDVQKVTDYDYALVHLLEEDEQYLKHFQQAIKKGREVILKAMDKEIKKPNSQMNKYAPKMITMTVKKEKIREVIGTGGKVIREIVETSGAKVDINDEGIIKIASSDQENIDKAKQLIHDIVDEAEEGKIYEGKVVKIMDFGAFVNFLGKKDGLVHISALSEERVEKVTDIVQEGDEVSVKVVGFDRGKVKLSMKQASA